MSFTPTQLNLLLDAIRHGEAKPVTAHDKAECERLVSRGHLDASYKITEKGRTAYDGLG